MKPLSPASATSPDYAVLGTRIRALAREFGFQRCGIAGIELGQDEAHLRQWLAEGLYGSMAWMARHGEMRARPADLLPGTLRVISVGLDYGRRDDEQAWQTIADGERAYVARYALGRDYHKLMRQRLQRLADRIAETVGPFGHRVFVDSAPVLERALARNAGLGWIGKHTCLIDKDGGSWFSSAKSTSTCRCRSMLRQVRIAGPACAASTTARPRQSLHRTGSTRAAASVT